MRMKKTWARNVAVVGAASLMLAAAAGMRADALSFTVTERVDPVVVKVGDLVTVPLLGEQATRRVIGADDIAQGKLLTVQVEGSPAPDPFGVLLSGPTDVVRAQIPYGPAVLALSIILAATAVRPRRSTAA